MAFDYFVEDESGNLYNSPIQVRTTGTTNSSGVFSVDLTGAALTHVHSAYAVVKGSTGGLTDTHVVSITDLTTSTVSGVAYAFTDVLGVLGLATTSSGVTVWLIVEGDQS
jgi:hypothetical protein